MSDLGGMCGGTFLAQTKHFKASLVPCTNTPRGEDYVMLDGGGTAWIRRSEFVELASAVLLKLDRPLGDPEHPSTVSVIA